MASDIAFDYGYAESAGTGAMPTRGAITQPLRVESGKLYRGAERFRMWGRSAIESQCTPDTTAECDGLVRSVLDMGGNTLQLFIGFGRVHNESGVNWGCMQYSTSAGGRDNSFNSARMATLDYLIAECTKHGIEVMVTNNVYGEWLQRAGLVQGMNKGYCMFWLADSAMAVFKEAFGAFLTRQNSYRGNERYIDNPGICWKWSNEEGLYDIFQRTSTATFGGTAGGSTSTTGWRDQIVNSQNGNGYWKAEIDGIINTYYQAQGWGTGFLPSSTDWAGWASGGTERTRIFAWARDRSTQVMADMDAWFASFNPRAHVIHGDIRYHSASIAAGAVNRTQSTHLYIQAGDFTVAANSTNYPSRPSILKNQWNGTNAFNDGSVYGILIGGVRNSTCPLVITEQGQYGENRYNHETAAFGAVFGSMQDLDGVLLFQVEQQAAQRVGDNATTYNEHVRNRRPALMLASRLWAPVFTNEWLAPLSTTHTATVSAADFLSRDAAGSTSHGTTYFLGNFRSFLGKRLYCQSGGATNTDSGNYPTWPTASYTSATVAAPLAITSEVGIHEGGAVINATRVAGWVNAVPGNATIGPISTGTISETLDAHILVVRSDSNAKLFDDRARLFFFGFDYPTDATGFSTTADLATVTTRGTMGNIRLRQPDPVVINLQTNKNCTVVAWTAAGTWVAISSTYTSGTGKLEFTTQAQYPEYVITPIIGSTSGSGRKGGGRK